MLFNPVFCHEKNKYHVVMSAILKTRIVLFTTQNKKTLYDSMHKLFEHAKNIMQIKYRYKDKCN